MMKKIFLLLMLFFSLACNASANDTWQYTPILTIQMDSATIETTPTGHVLLHFSATEILPDGTCNYKYIYDRTAETIQIAEMEKNTKTLHYKSNFTPLSIHSPNPVVQERAVMAEKVYQRKIEEKK